MHKHIPSCAVGQISSICQMTGKPHNWSGWPGAFCLNCGIADPDEYCIGKPCKCPCHDQFWKDYEKACRDAT